MVTSLPQSHGDLMDTTVERNPDRATLVVQLKQVQAAMASMPGNELFQSHRAALSITADDIKRKIIET